jgi:hypothetical protein
MSSLVLRTTTSRLAMMSRSSQALRSATAPAINTLSSVESIGTSDQIHAMNLNCNIHMNMKNTQFQLRTFGSKAGKMGHHLKNLDEIAHRENRKKKGKKSKQQSNGDGDGDGDGDGATTSFQVEEITLAEDENETKFDHGSNEGGGDDDTPSLPSKDDVQQRMMKVVNSMEDSFRAIRGAEPSPELFDSVQVKAYGAMTPLNAVGQVVITSPTMATISCFDPDTCTAVRDGVRDMTGMNFNPRVEDGVVIVPIPRVSADTRKVRVCFGRFLPFNSGRCNCDWSTDVIRNHSSRPFFRPS